MAPPLLPIVLGLAQYAPSLMRFLGAGESTTAVAEKVVDMAQTLTGAKSPEEALATIRANAELQAQFQQRALELDATLEQAYLGDRQDARRRDVELQRLGKGNVRADLMVLLDVIGLISCLVVIAVFRKEMPGEVVGLLTSVAATFGVCLRDAHQFEFGSSRSSRDKDALISARSNAGQGPSA